ncbi:MAG: ATP synthase F1 subunit delta [Acidobacteriota bacterium]
MVDVPMGDNTSSGGAPEPHRRSAVSDQDVAIASVYSTALLELAVAADSVESIGDQLDALAHEADRNADFRRFLSSPLIDADERRGSIERMFRGRLDDLLVDTLQVADSKGRLALLPALAEAYRRELQQRRNEVDVFVRTAIDIDQPTRDKIATAARSYTGQTPILHETVDPKLIGGIVIEVGDRKVDASVRHEVEKYRRLFEARASRELLRGGELVTEV